MTDMVDHPPHYQTETGLEAIDVIEAFFRYNYNLGQVFKYIARCGKKNNDIEDLKKARWYLDKEIEWREGTDEHRGDVEAFTPYPDDKTPKVGDRVFIKTGPITFGDGLVGRVEKVDSRDLPFPFYVRFDDGELIPYEKRELWCSIG